MLSETPELRGFQFPDGGHLVVPRTSIAPPRLVCSDNDPYCDPKPDKTWRCPNPGLPQSKVLADRSLTVTDAAYRRMVAQVHNDARGWDDAANAPFANAEPTDPSAIKGNFTKEEIQNLGAPGYKLTVGLGHTGDGPWFQLPQLKPLTELGLKDFVVPGWNGLMAPKGTPPAVVAKLSAALASALQTDASVKAFNAMGFIPGAGTPDPMTKQIEEDIRLFTAVIRERNLKFDT